MAVEIKLVKIYVTKKNKMRAVVDYAGQRHLLKLNGGPRPRCTFISMPVGFTSFEVQCISKCDTDHSITLRLMNEARSLVRLDFTSPQYI